MKITFTGTEILILSIVAERYADTGDTLRELANAFYEAYYNRSAHEPLPEILPAYMKPDEEKELDLTKDGLSILFVLLASYEGGSVKVTHISDKILKVMQESPEVI